MLPSCPNRVHPQSVRRPPDGRRAERTGMDSRAREGLKRKTGVTAYLSGREREFRTQKGFQEAAPGPIGAGAA